MDTQLKIMEKEYMKLFTGISIHKTLSFHYKYIPVSNQINTEIPIFKFSRSKRVPWTWMSREARSSRSGSSG